jgi:hypothetical protein
LDSPGHGYFGYIAYSKLGLPAESWSQIARKQGPLHPYIILQTPVGSGAD